jgi:hypothetical protein
VDLEPVVNALLMELHRQGQQALGDENPPFVGPTDIPNHVHIDGSIDVQALAAAVVLAAVATPPPN